MFFLRVFFLKKKNAGKMGPKGEEGKGDIGAHAVLGGSTIQLQLGKHRRGLPFLRYYSKKITVGLFATKVDAL
jgi:hypothetical protein